MTSERATWLAMARPSLRAKLNPPSAIAARIERARAGKGMRRIVGLDIVDRKTVQTALRDPIS
jgi:hypothetical protein